MPRLTKLQRAIAEAIAGEPFSPYYEPADARKFENLPDDVREGIVFEIYEDFKVRGFSAGACRAKYGGTSDANPSEFNRGLSGDVRRNLFREYDRGDGIARSYVRYRNGNPRAGSAHARTQGEAAQARAAEAARVLAEETAKADAKQRRTELRAAGIAPSRSARKLATQYAEFVAGSSTVPLANDPELLSREDAS